VLRSKVGASRFEVFEANDIYELLSNVFPQIHRLLWVKEGNWTISFYIEQSRGVGEPR